MLALFIISLPASRSSPKPKAPTIHPIVLVSFRSSDTVASQTPSPNYPSHRARVVPV
jgi:hypothetical protein